MTDNHSVWLKWGDKSLVTYSYATSDELLAFLDGISASGVQGSYSTVGPDDPLLELELWTLMRELERSGNPASPSQSGKGDEIVVVREEDIPGAVEYSENALADKADRIKTLTQIIELAIDRLCPDDLSDQEWSAFSSEVQQQLVRSIQRRMDDSLTRVENHKSDPTT